MTTTELIELLKQNEKGGISHKSREISLTINGKYMPNPKITLSSTGDGICGAEIDLDIDGDFMEEQEPQWHEAEDPPSDDRLILLSFVNYPVPAIGRYIGNEEDGGSFYIDSAEKSLSSLGLFVNGWQELPKCREE